MSLTSEAFDFESALARIDQARNDLRRGVLVPYEAVNVITSSVDRCLSESLLEPDEVEFLVSYAIDVVDDLAEDALDRALATNARDHMQFISQRPELRRHFRDHLDGLDFGLRFGDSDCVEALIDLAREGRSSHPAWFLLDGAADEVLRVAYRHRISAALVAAVDPSGDPGRIARGDRSWASLNLAFDLLAHLAADPLQRCDQARTELVRLASYVETAGEAAIRLPLHMLDASDRAALLQTYEARVDLFATDTIVIPVAVELTRDTDVVRGAVWQAADAHRIRSNFRH